MRKILDTRDCGFIWVSKVLARSREGATVEICLEDEDQSAVLQVTASQSMPSPFKPAAASTAVSRDEEAPAHIITMSQEGDVLADSAAAAASPAAAAAAARQDSASRANAPMRKQQGHPNQVARVKKKPEQLNLPSEVLEALIQLYPQHARFAELLQQRQQRHPEEDASMAAGAAAAAACQAVPLLPKELFVKQLVQSCCIELKEKVVIFSQVRPWGNKRGVLGADALGGHIDIIMIS
jgi:hypothetical protein